MSAGTAEPARPATGLPAGSNRWELEVHALATPAPGFRRLVLGHPALTDLSYQPGQDISFLVDREAERPVRRRYTIAAADRAAGTVSVDVALHGVDRAGPGERWARGARVGDRIEGIGPRGKVSVQIGAGWHLFVGDETFLPATAAMMAAVPAGERASALSTAPLGHRLSIPGDDVRYVHGDDLLAAIDLPAGGGHVYLGAEATVVVGLRTHLAGRGWGPERVSAKAYWNRGRPNASHGEPARD